jgi:hypothetical protein
MKTLSKITAMVLLAVLTLVGCRKDELTTGGSSSGSSGSGSMSVLMTGGSGSSSGKIGPALYSKINVEVTGVEINYSGAASGWISLPAKAGIYNLLELQNNVTTVLVEGTTLPPGMVSQLRLILGTHNSVSLPNDATYELTVPSGDETGIKINLDATITSKADVKVILDFIADASIIVTGNNTYMLKPVIEAKIVQTVPTIPNKPYITPPPATN